MIPYFHIDPNFFKIENNDDKFIIDHLYNFIENDLD